MIKLFRALSLIAILFAPLSLWAQATTSVLVQIENPRIVGTSETLTFDLIVDPNGGAPAESLTLSLLIKSSKTSYVAAIRNAVKALVLANEGVTLTNADIIIWPLLE